MACENCNPTEYYPGKIIRCNSNLGTCSICGSKIMQPSTGLNHKWDIYFHTICEAVASKSPCLSRKIGAILVKDHSIVSTGFNGPSRGIPHCGHDRFASDKSFIEYCQDEFKKQGTFPNRRRLIEECPRKLLNYASGTHMELCPAVHAEANAVIDAARKGASTIGTTLYMNCIIPCKNCFSLLINAGIVSIVVDDTKVYDSHTQYLINNSKINIRRFEI